MCDSLGRCIFKVHKVTGPDEPLRHMKYNFLGLVLKVGEATPAYVPRVQLGISFPETHGLVLSKHPSRPLGCLFGELLSFKQEREREREREFVNAGAQQASKQVCERFGPSASH